MKNNEIKKEVLIIEDDFSILKSITRLLTLKGYEVLHAIDGVAGLKTALDRKPDLILLDILMPGMDGIELLGKLRRDEWGSEVKVIVITNAADSQLEKLKNEELKISNDDIIIKSNVDIGEISKKIAEILG